MTQLIADSGSTKTEWRLVENEQVNANVRTIGFNPYYADTTTIVAGLRQQLLPHLMQVPDAVYFYGSGCTGPAANQIVADAIQIVYPGARSVDVASDMLGAARAAVGRATIGRAAGVVCILGTGSNAALYDGTTITSPSRSLGFWLGDEGSGAYLGRTLVVQFLHGLLPADLAQGFRQRFAIDRLTVLDHAYQQPFPNRYFSQFTPFLSAHSEHPFVDALVHDAFMAFLQLYVLPYPEARQMPVHFVGSVAQYFESQLRRAVQHCELQTGRIVPAPIDELVRYHQTR